MVYPGIDSREKSDLLCRFFLKFWKDCEAQRTVGEMGQMGLGNSGSSGRLADCQGSKERDGRGSVSKVHVEQS